MKKNRWILLFSLLLFSCANEEEATKEEPKKVIVKEKAPIEIEINDSVFVSGDIIFQTTFNRRSDLISIATQSPFTHCGLIIKTDNKYFVVEANGMVKTTELDTWKMNGKESKYVVMRFKNRASYDNPENSEKAKKAIQKSLNIPYDSKYLWSNDEYYCSELVWKLYKESFGIELCPLKQLGDYDLTDEKIKKELEKMYGKNIPLTEPIVSPADIAASDQLEMIYSNY